MLANPVDRVAVAALELKPLRILLSVVAAPFYAFGFLLGLVLVGLTWVYAAVQVGLADARRKPDVGA